MSVDAIPVLPTGEGHAITDTRQRSHLGNEVLPELYCATDQRFTPLDPQLHQQLLGPMTRRDEELQASEQQGTRALESQDPEVRRAVDTIRRLCSEPLMSAAPAAQTLPAVVAHRPSSQRTV